MLSDPGETGCGGGEYSKARNQTSPPSTPTASSISLGHLLLVQPALLHPPNDLRETIGRAALWHSVRAFLEEACELTEVLELGVDDRVESGAYGIDEFGTFALVD